MLVKGMTATGNTHHRAHDDSEDGIHSDSCTSGSSEAPSGVCGASGSPPTQCQAEAGRGGRCSNDGVGSDRLAPLLSAVQGAVDGALRDLDEEILQVGRAGQHWADKRINERMWVDALST